MATVKKYLDYAGLQAYDTAIKAWANGASQLGYKSFVVNEGKLYLFSKPNATSSDIVASGEGATPYVDISGSSITSTLNALASVVGATYSNGAYSLALTGFGQDVDTAVEALNELRSALTTVQGDNTTAGSFAKAIKDAIEDLDVAEFALASKDSTTNVITIKGIKEADGKIAVGTDTTKDVTLAAVAATGAAANVSVADSGNKLTATNVEDALAELADLAGDGSASKTVSMVASGATADYANVYNIYQGANTYVADRTDGKTNPTLVGTINIPKDQFVDEASLVDITFDSENTQLKDGSTNVTSLIKGEGTPTTADAGKYIKLVFAVTSGTASKNTVYVSVKSLVDVYTAAANASEVQITISNNNEISATIVKVAASKIVYKAAHDDVAEETVADALDNIGSIALDGTGGDSNNIAALFA